MPYNCWNPKAFGAKCCACGSDFLFGHYVQRVRLDPDTWQEIKFNAYAIECDMCSRKVDGDSCTTPEAAVENWNAEMEQDKSREAVRQMQEWVEQQLREKNQQEAEERTTAALQSFIGEVS